MLFFSQVTDISVSGEVMYVMYIGRLHSYIYHFPNISKHIHNNTISGPAMQCIQQIMDKVRVWLLFFVMD